MQNSLLSRRRPRQFDQADHSVNQSRLLKVDQLGLVVLHVLDECASGVVGAEDLLVYELFGEVLSEEGGEWGGGEVGGGEPEDVYDLAARIEMGVFRKL